MQPWQSSPPQQAQQKGQAHSPHHQHHHQHQQVPTSYSQSFGPPMPHYQQFGSQMPPPHMIQGPPPPGSTSYVTYGPPPPGQPGMPYYPPGEYVMYGPPPQQQYMYGPPPPHHQFAPHPYPYAPQWPGSGPPYQAPPAQLPFFPQGSLPGESPESMSSGSGSGMGAVPRPPPWAEEGRRPFHQKKMVELGVHFTPLPKGDDFIRAPTGKGNYHLCEHALFMGQLHNACTLDMVMWLIDLLSNGQAKPVHLHRRGAGCVMVYFDKPEPAALLRAKNGFALFDYTGIWLAKNEAQAEQMRDYVRSIRTTLQQAHLPGDCIVIRQ